MALSLKSVLQETCCGKKEKVPGGKASGMSPSDFDQDALMKGIHVELEHTSDILTAMEIAMDHLAEDPEYYEKLSMIHDEE